MTEDLIYQNRDFQLKKRISILMCKDCGVVEEDMVFVPAYQPYFKGWYCINCYEEYAKDYAKYYILSESEGEGFNNRLIIQDNQTFIEVLETVGWVKRGDVFLVKPPEAEFKVNNYILLQFRNDSTVLFANNEQFSQCISLFISVNRGDKRQLNVNSIDEASEVFRFEDYRESSRMRFQIEPESVFWGHCSNLQAWVENDYDTRLLHRNLAFPLLKTLTIAGDPIAKRVFKEEITKRYNSGYSTVKKFLRKEGYLKYLSKEELSPFLQGKRVKDKNNFLI